MAGYFVGEAGVYFAHAGHGGVEAGITLRVALLKIADVFDPLANAAGGWAVDAMLWRETQTFDGDGFVDFLGVDAGVVEDYAAA
jgi:hypothetical protein